MSREINPFAFRMPPELRAKVEEAAKENRRSINAELVARVEETFANNPSENLDESTRILKSAERLEKVIEVLAELGQQMKKAGSAEKPKD
ncbi:Arc family DNA-binding protein [Azomonas macrocytogenes]|uniref:Arc-like DNA binding domain-containing protein n=1 Tax=Azomonas macrocytogenes TaxID=69962 RepID=A0A839T7Z7_AZOMA|nr:Arc family DNA-binding protein [Azomonas macrocytogenes]MBB3103783.1 hypothetical protein [Azomonas macrocytogenes]